MICRLETWGVGGGFLFFVASFCYNGNINVFDGLFCDFRFISVSSVFHSQQQFQGDE